MVYGVSTLVHMLHAVASCEARVLSIEGRRPLDDEHVTSVIIGSPRPVQEYEANRRLTEGLARMQVQRVFGDHVIMTLDEASVAWAENLMLDATAHYEEMSARLLRSIGRDP